DRILDFPERDVEHAMIPRARVDAVHASDTLGQVRDQMATGHSRYPVLAEDDQVVGVVHLVDVLTTRHADDVAAQELMRPAIVIPTAMTLPDALRKLTETRNQLACVIDEYGGFAGVLTAEDLAEE